MFDIGWTEMLVVAMVAIIVVGPKDLPKMLRSFGKVMGNMRRMAGDFQKQFDDAVREAELDEVKNVASGKGFAPLDDIKKATEKYNQDLKKSIDDAGSSASKSQADNAAGKMASAGDDPGAIAEETLPEPVKPAGSDKTSKPASKTTVAATKPATRKAAPKKAAPKKTAAKKTASKNTAPKNTAKAS